MRVWGEPRSSFPAPVASDGRTDHRNCASGCKCSLQLLRHAATRSTHAHQEVIMNMNAAAAGARVKPLARKLRCSVSTIRQAVENVYTERVHSFAVMPKI